MFRAVTSLAVKYEVHGIIEEARYRLSCVFPADDIDSWDPDLRPDGGDTLLKLQKDDCVDLIRIVRLLDMQEILPLVFYVSCNMELDDAPYGRDYEDGEGPVTFTKDDLRTYIKGRQALIEERQRGLRVFQELAANAKLRSSSCTTHSHCRQSLLQLSLRALDQQLYACAESLSPMDQWLTSNALGARTCPCNECLAILHKLLDERRAEAWRNLGKIFNVPEWPGGKLVGLTHFALFISSWRHSI